MKKSINTLVICILALFCSAQIQHPAAWLRADSAILGVASWPDVSGNGLDAVPSSGTVPTAFSRMNFNRCFEVCAPTLTLCTADSLPLYGRVAEAMYFDHRISDTAVIQWISYLALKYGVTLVQTDYLDSRRIVI